jgi:hypothetical protein
MNLYLIPIPLNLIGVILYWIARQRNDLNRVAIIQPLNTALSILIALLSLSPANPLRGFTY